MQKDFAIQLFLRIGYGKDKAVKRLGNKIVDRRLRELISEWNMDSEHDTIINTGDGYYIPRKGNQAEMLEYKEYIAKERDRGMLILGKVSPMERAYERMLENEREPDILHELCKGNQETAGRRTAESSLVYY